MQTLKIWLIVLSLICMFALILPPLRGMISAVISKIFTPSVVKGATFITQWTFFVMKKIWIAHRNVLWHAFSPRKKVFPTLENADKRKLRPE
ncbi:hypothetical protein [Burkholderia cepacia]|uniref:hypothetical protein n=1 Tax=Burkholderia cepacia TaxID=292 RepID=UPI002AB72580|nr:hypothetical protein [Burkholderia cepacia]